MPRFEQQFIVKTWILTQPLFRLDLDESSFLSCKQTDFIDIGLVEWFWWMWKILKVLRQLSRSSLLFTDSTWTGFTGTRSCTGGLNWAGRAVVIGCFIFGCDRSICGEALCNLLSPLVCLLSHLKMFQLSTQPEDCNDHNRVTFARFASPPPFKISVIIASGL